MSLLDKNPYAYDITAVPVVDGLRPEPADKGEGRHIVGESSPNALADLISSDSGNEKRGA